MLTQKNARYSYRAFSLPPYGRGLLFFLGPGSLGRCYLAIGRAHFDKSPILFDVGNQNHIVAALAHDILVFQLALFRQPLLADLARLLHVSCFDPHPGKHADEMQGRPCVAQATVCLHTVPCCDRLKV